MHFACLSSFSISCHVESCSGDSVIGNPTMHCHFDIKIHYTLPAAQSKSSAHCPCAYAPTQNQLYVCFSYAFYFYCSYNRDTLSAEPVIHNILHAVRLSTPPYNHSKLQQVTYFQIVFMGLSFYMFMNTFHLFLHDYMFCSFVFIAM